MKRACGRVTERKIKFLIWLSLHVFTAPKTEKAVVSPSKILKRVPFVYIWFVLFACSFCIGFLFVSDSRNSSSFATVTRVQTRLQLTKYLCELRRRSATCDKNNFA